MIKLTVDGKTVQTEDGTTILEAARQAGIDIPTLCYHKGIEPCVSCFICIVAVDGCEKFLPSCATAVTDGMVVDTCSKEVIDCRRHALDLMLSVHAGECAMPCSQGNRDPALCKVTGRAKCFRCGCEKNSSCKLKQYALQYGVSFYSYKNSENYERKVYESGLVHEPGKCIVCGKCINITRERNIKPGLSFCSRGSNVHVSAPFGFDIDRAMGNALEECANACPTGALQTMRSA